MAAPSTIRPTDSTPTDEALIEDHLELAQRIARRFRRRGVDLDDLVQVARLALVKAAAHYQPDRGPFAPYAATTISGELKRYFRDHAWVVRPPRRIQDLQAGLSAERELQPREADPRRFAEALGADVADVREAMAARGCFTCDSIESAEEAGHPFGVEDAGFAAVDDRLVLASLWRHLDADERQLLTWRYFDELTQQQIADRLGISQMQVSRRLSQLLARLRGRVEPLAA